MTAPLRRPFALRDTPITLFLAALGCLLGFFAAILVFTVADGHWFVLLLLIPIALYVVLGEVLVHLIVWLFSALWAAVRDKPLPTRPPTFPRTTDDPPKPQPWLKDHALTLAMVLFFTYTIINGWWHGVFEEGFL